MNTLRVSYTARGVLENLHPSDPLKIVLDSYISAVDFMQGEVPSATEVMSALRDNLDSMYNNQDAASMDDMPALTLMDVEEILRSNGFDFIDYLGWRENSSQILLGGENHGAV